MATDGYVNRETGQFPLSIGTSLALEGLLGIHPGRPDQPSGYKTIRSVWINIRTLVRNLYQAMKADDLKRFSFENAVYVLLEEIRIIPEVARDRGQNYEFVFYYQDPKQVKVRFPNAAYKEAKTEKQLHSQSYEKVVMASLVSILLQDKFPLVEVKNAPQSHPKVTAIMTHLPVELLWKGSFDRLFLLESYTGRLKTYNAWFTKLNGVDADNPIPFTEFTLQVFGDGTMFDSQPKKIRDEVRQLAELKHWTGSTNAQKVIGDVLGFGSRELKNTYAHLMK